MEKYVAFDKEGIPYIRGFPQTRGLLAIERLALYEKTDCSPNEVREMQKNCETLSKDIEALSEENKKLCFMIENGLGWEDMRNDISDAYQSK